MAVTPLIYSYSFTTQHGTLHSIVCRNGSNSHEAEVVTIQLIRLLFGSKLIAKTLANISNT